MKHFNVKVTAGDTRIIAGITHIECEPAEYDQVQYTRLWFWSGERCVTTCSSPCTLEYVQ